MELTVCWRYDDHLFGSWTSWRSGYLEFLPLQESFAEELKDERNSHRKVVMRVLYGSEEEVELGPVKLQDAMEKVLEHILMSTEDLDTPELVAQRLWQHKLSDFCPRGRPRLFQSCLMVKRNEGYEVWSVEQIKSEAKRRVEELVRQHPTDSASGRECHVSAAALHSYKLSRHSKGKVSAFLPSRLQLVQFNECPLPVLLEDTEVGEDSHATSCKMCSIMLHQILFAF